MTPSEASNISSMFSTPSLFSIFEIICTSYPPWSFKNFRILLMSSARRTKEAATKSTSFLMPNKISSLSFSLKNGMDNLTFGTFTPLRSDTFPPFLTWHTISVSFNSITSISTRPSSIKMVDPTDTSWYKSGYEMEMPSLSPSRSVA